MKNTKTTFATFCETLSALENELLTQFFSEFDTHFLVSKSNRKQFKTDFEAAIMLLYKQGVPMEEVPSRLALSNLGGFYARPSVMWFPLDDAAKKWCDVNGDGVVDAIDATLVTRHAVGTISIFPVQ